MRFSETEGSGLISYLLSAQLRKCY